VYDRFFNGRRDIVRTSIDQGLNVTLNSDDPAFFGGYQNANFIKATGDSNLTKSELILIARNGINATFATDAQKVEMLTELDRYVSQILDGDQKRQISKVESMMLQSWALSL
jgi:adenosine deaminase